MIREIRLTLQTNSMKIKDKLKTIGLLIVIFTSFSCSDSDSDNPEGDWGDNIKLSQKEAQFTSENDSILITTEGDYWWLNGISLNGTSNFDLKGIDLNAKNFIIEETEFTIERKNATEIYIKMTKNLTGSERVLIINLQAGNYFDRIIITQSAN